MKYKEAIELAEKSHLPNVDDGPVYSTLKALIEAVKALAEQQVKVIDALLEKSRRESQ